MGLQKEVWATDIAEQLFSGSEFINRSVDHSAWVDNKIVHVGQSGALPAIVKDRAVFPASIVERTDTVLDYNLGSFDIGALRITDIDELQTAYEKRASLLGQHLNSLNDRLGLETAFNWAGVGSGTLVRTTGTASSDALAPSATGTRLAVTKKDIRNMAKKLDQDNVPRMGRYLLMDTQMMYQLFEDSAITSRDFTDSNSQDDGVITKLYSFNILARPEVVIYTNAATPVKKAVGAAGAATDNLACIGWHQSVVSNATGDIKVFANEDVAEHFGSIFSCMVMHGSSKLRTDEKGIVTLVQA